MGNEDFLEFQQDIKFPCGTLLQLAGLGNKTSRLENFDKNWGYIPVSFFFSLIGVVGLLGVLISIVMLLVDEAPFFHEIALGKPQLAHVADKC